MDVHPVCDIFPMMGPEEFRSFKDDIRDRGLQDPIWTYQGQLIDGRNRLKACEELGRDPLTREWDGSGSLVEFVVSLNLHRRHLNSSQRAACGVEIEERLAVEAKARQAEQARRNQPQAKRPDPTIQKVEIVPPLEKAKARDQAAKIVGTNPRYIQDAKAVKAADPALHERVKAGEITVPQARRQVDRVEKRAALEARAKAVKPSAGVLPWSIIEGDCLDILPEIEPGSVRLVFADPPYNIGVDYGDGEEADLLPPAEYLAWCRRWIEAAVRTLAPDGSMWVLINHEAAARVEVMLDEAGLAMRDWITWYEPFGNNCSTKFNRTSRRLLHAVKDPDRSVFHADAVNRPSDRQAKYGDRRADPGGKIWDDVWGVNPPIPRLVDNAEERIPDFPTQLPLDLLRPIVGCASDPGDLVIDPFSGSGTTSAACIELGRRSLGIERNPEYARLARMRLEAIRPIHRAEPGSLS